MLETGVLDDAPLHRALAGLRESGVAVGISTSGPEQAAAVRRALRVRVDGLPLFTSVQATWNVLETSVAPALAEAADAGARVLIKESLANGRLAGAQGEGSPGAARAAEIAASIGVGPDVLAVAAALAQPWASIVLSGAVTPDQVDRTVAATRLEPADDVLPELARLAEDPYDYWASRSRRPWS